MLTEIFQNLRLIVMHAALLMISAEVFADVTRQAAITDASNSTKGYNPATLTLTHTIINDGGGSATKDDFEIYINGVTGVWGVKQSLNAGAYSLVLSSVDGYQSSHWQGDCHADGSIVLVPGQAAFCEIVSNDTSVDITVDKSVSDLNPSVGDVVTFSLLVKNNGSDDALNVEVSDVVLSGLEYQSGSMLGANLKLQHDPYDGGLKWHILTLRAGVPVKLTFDALVLPVGGYEN